MAALTIATHRKEVRIDLGVIAGEGEAVSGYVENPTIGYEALIAAGERVCRYEFSGARYDIGTAGELTRASEAYDAESDRFDATDR